MAVRMIFLCVSLLTTAALAAEPAAEPLDVLRQRLAERLSNKAEPVGGVLRGTGKGRDEPTKAKAKSGAKPGDKSADGAHAHTPENAHAHAHVHAQGTGLPHWGYAGDVAPERWAELSPEFQQCGIGTRQSPIDIRDSIKVDLEKIQFDYRPSGFAVLDSGHTVQVNLTPGNALQVMGRRYDLAQLHFHRPSEERINGRQFDMVAHLVHKDAEGRLAVVAVLLEQGLDQPLVQTIWNNLPLERGEALPAPGLLDMTQLLPENRSYYTYMGSLTVPPCTEGVLWMVMRQPVQLSAHQLAIFAKLYPMNARPIQSGSGRLIKESN